MQYLRKYTGNVSGGSAHKPINVGLFRLLLGLLIVLNFNSGSATPASVLPMGLTPGSLANSSGSGQSSIDPVTLMEDIKKKLAATKGELDLETSNSEQSSINGLSSDDEDRISRRLRLRQLMFLYQGQLARLDSLQMRQQRLNDLENQVTNWSGFSEPILHPFLKADELTESVDSLSSRVNELESWIGNLEASGEQTISNADESAVKLRQADEAVEKAKNTHEQAVLNKARDLLILQNQVDLARTMGVQIEKLSIQEELREAQTNLQLARKQLSMIPAHVELTLQDIEQVNKNIENASQHVIAELNNAMSAFDSENKSINHERQESVPLEKIAKPETMTDEQLEQLHQMRLITADIKVQTLNRILVYLQMQRDIWSIRWLYAKVTDREKAEEAYKRIAKNQEILLAARDYISQQRSSRLTLLTNEAVLETDPTVSGSDALRDESRNLDLEQVVSYSRFLGAIEATENLLERFKQELDDRFRVKTFSDYLEDAKLKTRDFAAQVWDFELFAVQDNIEVDGQIISGKRSVTVDKVLTALAILIVGYWIAVRLARFIEGLFVKRLGMDASLAHIAQRWILFLEVLVLVVLSMSVVRIPLAIFTFMGGAVAIGAGFGMQNLLKNLISGIMLLFERPFRPGDVVEVGGIRGRVMDIGVRSSHILDANGIETLIPNSTFIEQNVTNWTLTSKSVRIVVNIGIAYDSPIREVTKILLEAADRHGLVLKDPAPQVLFEDFGSDALVFGLYVWVIINPDISWKTIASDLRFMLSKTLVENGIVISFPQRDIHLDTSRPLEVRVLADTPESRSVQG